ncbi:MAG: hypothetical protein ACRD8Z_19490, partial [Nitrososphaeraceae archaeon]
CIADYILKNERELIECNKSTLRVRLTPIGRELLCSMVEGIIVCCKVTSRDLTPELGFLLCKRKIYITYHS